MADLIHPGERLIDFWCGHPQPKKETVLTAASLIYLHPQLSTDTVKEAWEKTLEQGQSFKISNFLKTPAQSSLFQAEIVLDFVTATVLWPLLEKPMKFDQIKTRWLNLYPKDWKTEKPSDLEVIQKRLAEILLMLEKYLYILIVSD